MIRRFNYTGRRRVPRSRLRVVVHGDAQHRSFDAVLDLDGLGLPDDASVFVEAYHRTVYRRFSYGRISDLRPPGDRRLPGFPVRNPLFRVKVVREEDGIARILAAADRVVPRQSDGGADRGIPLLPVEFDDLGDRVFALDLEGDWPLLTLNRRIDGIRDAARSAPEFLALVYPEIVRAVFERIIADGDGDPDCDDDWRSLWLRYACRGLGRPRPFATADDASQGAWVEHTVDAFCAKVRASDTYRRLIHERGG